MTFDVTRLSKVVYLSGGLEEYELYRSSQGESVALSQENEEVGACKYDEYTLYIVPVKSSTEGTGSANYPKYSEYLLAYYGDRQLTNVIAADSLPVSEEYPDEVLYVQFSENELSDRRVSKIHYRYSLSSRKTDVLTYKGQGVRQLTFDNSLGLLNIEFFEDSCNVLVTDSQGSLNNKILNNLVEDTKSYISEFVANSNSENYWSKF